MDNIFSFLFQGFGIAIAPLNLSAILVGSFIGTVAGALPGVGPINAIAVFLPIAYALGLPPETALMLLSGIYFGAEYGGRISSILLNIPGASGAIMTNIDGYPLARKGLAGTALALSGISSFIGSILSVIGLTLFGPSITELAIKFGPAEYFALIFFAFASLSAIADKSPIKTLISTVLGLMLATIGTDSITGVLRYTYGEPKLYEGIDFLTVVIGLFAISEILLFLEVSHRGHYVPVKIGKITVKFKEVLRCKWAIARATLVGFIIGVLPGIGSSMASALAYTTEKSLNPRNNTFGKGNMSGLAAVETANNASVGGSFVPTLTLGIPGSPTAALLLGAMSMYDIQSGPLLFSEYPKIAAGLIASMYISNLILFIFNVPLVKLFARMLLLPNWVLVPGIVVLSFVGIFSMHGGTLSLFLMLGIGVFGYCLRKLRFSLVPFILGFVLEDLMEDNLRRALAISGGQIGILFESQISQALWLLIGMMLLGLPILKLFLDRRQRFLLKHR
jgi:putative tricarboxylic transport membrane protein